MKQILTALCLLLCITAGAEIPPGYYSRLNGRTGADLKAACHEIIYPHSEVSSYTALPQYFARTDVYPGSNKWWDMYSNIPRYAPNFSGLNREHSFPKSWWGGDQDIPAYVDLFHLYPADGPANMAKSNYPMGVVATATFDNGVTRVGYPVTGLGGGASQVFEPDDEYKGDFARTYFYMVTCYSNLTWVPKYSWMLQSNAYPTLSPWAREMLLEWARQDPVSQKERDRNEQVYLVQNNRNPFIDFPQLFEYIWGRRTTEPFSTDIPDTPIGEPNLITPVQDMALDFGQVALGQSITSRLFFKGENCLSAFSLRVSGDNRTLFTLDSRIISASAVNSEAGYWLNVTYTPTSLGTHTARLVISDGGLEGSRGVQLIGECLPAPTLTAVKALEPTDITADSYTARWEAATEVVDYYIVTRTRYIDGLASSEEIEADGTHLVIDDFADSDYESYTVQSVRLGYRSPASNAITVQHASIDAVGADSEAALAVLSYQGYIRFVCAGTVGSVEIFDLSGREVLTLPSVTDNQTITLPRGVYLVRQRGSRRMLKAVSF